MKERLDDFISLDGIKEDIKLIEIPTRIQNEFITFD